jgi:hypothetical protein
VIAAAHTRGVSLDEHLRRPRIERSPTAAPFAVVVAARASFADAAAQLRIRPEPARHHDRVVDLVDVDTLDHHAPVDTERARP